MQDDRTKRDLSNIPEVEHIPPRPLRLSIMKRIWPVETLRSLFPTAEQLLAVEPEALAPKRRAQQAQQLKGK
jgi:hypothetical protein